MNWRRTSAYASAVLVGGIAVYYSYFQEAKGVNNNNLKPSASSTKGSSKSNVNSKVTGTSTTTIPFSLAKHPSRLFQEQLDLKTVGKLCIQAITENEYSISYSNKGQVDNKGTGVESVHVCSLASNEPIEDRHAHNSYRLPKSGKILSIFGVFDGHSGDECSDTLRRFAAPYIASAISKASSLGPGGEGKVAEAIEESLAGLDDEMLRVALDPQFNVKATAVLPAVAGSVSTVAALYDGKLFLANTGDVRAVIGQLQTQGQGQQQVQGQAMTFDHTAQNEQEVERMLREHPDESKADLLRHNRVLGGLMPLRAFGDASYKWTKKQIENLSRTLLSNGQGSVVNRVRGIKNSKTPPYVTARPEMTEHELKPGTDLFLILASDGLWDVVSNQQAAEIVYEYITKVGEDVKSQENAASYLVRNALERNAPKDMTGEWYCGNVLGIPPPYSRRYRDDITVQIVFFDSADISQGASGSGKVYQSFLSDVQDVKYSHSHTKYQSSSDSKL